MKTCLQNALTEMAPKRSSNILVMITRWISG